MTRLVLTDNAKADTAEILDYLAREAGARVAEDFGRRFRATIERLADLPEIGAPRARLGPNIRIAVVYPLSPHLPIHARGRHPHFAPHSARQTQHHRRFVAG